jgi:hypothetical protein
VPSPRIFLWYRKQLQCCSSYSPSLQPAQTQLRPKPPGVAASMVEAVATSNSVAPMGAASTDEDSTDEASSDTGSWTALDTGTTMDMPIGTESLLGMMNALSSASV